VNGRMLYLGNERLAHERSVCTPASEASLREAERRGQTVVLLSSDSQPLGIVALADEIRPEAPGALRSLRWAGIHRIVMLTGDNVETAEAVSQRLGIDDFRAELMPEEKVDMVRQLEESGQSVAFVGDGVNDAPALAAATVGIAMGAAGSDVALETADIALMSDDLSRLAFLIQISRKTSRIIRQNIVFSILIKVVFIVLALVGWATLWMAVAADMGASLAVIANGLRTLRVEDQVD